MLIGARDLSDYEIEFIRLNSINHIPTDQSYPEKESITPGLHQLIQAGISKLHIHIDADVFDPSIAPANSYAVNNGLSKENIIETIKHIASHIPIASLTIASYDPAYDKEDKMLTTINEIEVIADLIKI